MKPLVSICMLTIDRYQLTKFCLDELINKSGIDRDEIELLILDNGSVDKRTIDLGIQNAEVHIAEPKNIGVSKGFNKLFKESSGKYICTVGNDISVQNNWLKDLISYQEKIKNSGISAIYCLLDKGKYNSNLNVYIPQSGLVYGNAIWNRNLFEKIGYFDENLSGYGCEDSQYCYRAFATGHINYYVPNQYSTHLGEDLNEDSEYRKLKDTNLKLNQKKLYESLMKMKAKNNYKIIK